MLKQLLQTAIISLIGAIVSCSVFFLFLSVFIFNLEIQNFSGDYMNIKSKTNIIQVDLFQDNLKAYFLDN